jgi:hypothetical protein
MFLEYLLADETTCSAYSVTQAFFILCLLSEPTEMVLHSYQVLEPWVYLSFQIAKSIFWSVYLACAILVWVKNGAGVTEILRIWKLVQGIVTILTA